MSDESWRRTPGSVGPRELPEANDMQRLEARLRHRRAFVVADPKACVERQQALCDEYNAAEEGTESEPSRGRI